jgi:hypothetical protein
MMIRDTGSTVELWLRSSDPATHSGALPYSYSGVGGSGSGTVNYPTGSPWVKVKTLTVTTTGNVTFAIGATGTSGFGGPTSFTHLISRTTVPDAPVAKPIYNVLHTSFTFEFDDPADTGGSAITGREYMLSDVNTFAGAVWTAAPSTGIVNITGKKPGTVYYAKARVRNASGYSPISAIRTTRTLAGAKVRVGGVWKDAIPYVRVAGVWHPAIPYVRVLGVWKTTVE